MNLCYVSNLQSERMMQPKMSICNVIQLFRVDILGLSFSVIIYVKFLFCIFVIPLSTGSLLQLARYPASRDLFLTVKASTSFKSY